MSALPVRREGSADLVAAVALAIALCALAPAAARAADPAPGPEPAAAGAPPAPPDPAAAPPAPAPPAPPVRQVGEVTAHATRSEREVLDVPGNVTVIDREQIDRSGARTVPELLRRQPGIFVTNTSTTPAGTFLDARGFNNGGGNGAGLLVLVDGRRANEPDTGSVDWALLPLDMVERIEIVRGPASALYGDGAVGGVLHIRTRPLEGPPRAAVRGLYGRYDTAGGSLRAAGTFADWTAGLFVDGLVTDGYRDNSAFDSQDVKGSLETTLFDRVVVGSSGGRHYDDRELPGGLTFAQIDALGRRASDPVLAENRGDVESWFWDGWVEASLAPEVELRLLPYFFHRDDFTRIAFTNVGPEPSVPFDIDGEKRQGGVDLQLRVDRPLFGLANRLIVGATYLHDEVDRSSVSGAFFSQRAVGERDVSGGFAQEELWLREDLLLAAGVRYDDGSYRLRLTDRLSGQTARDDPDLDAWSPKASLTWRFLPVASAYFSWARGFRLPDFDEDLPILNFDGSTTLPDLGVQRSEAFELGSKLEAKDLSAGVALYWMRVRDEILFDPEPPPGGFFGENVNLDRVRHRGVELSGSWRVLPWLTLAGGYTFDDVKVLDDDDATIEGSRMPITPRHRGNLAAVAELPLGFEPLDVELGANANLVGKRIVANDFQRELSQLDAYETLDLWLRLRPQLGERVAATLSFAVRNVTGERYEDYANCRGCPLRPFFPVPEAVVYPAARRSYEVGLLVELRP